MDSDTILNTADVRYIKLGEGGAWARAAFQRNEIFLGYGDVPHEVATQSREVIRTFLLEIPRYATKATDHARQIHDFYNLGETCLWITFANDHLYWTQASSEVVWLEKASNTRPSRMRRCLTPWSNRNLQDVELVTSSLSSRLTAVSAFRSTICRIKAHDYLLRRIAGIEEPLIARANTLQSEMTGVVAQAIAMLHWTDFETLVDLVFARSGWHRTSALGGRIKDVDLELENTVTSERAFVQIKSSADQTVLDDYIDRYDRAGTYQRMIFVCHSPKAKLSVPRRKDIHLWEGEHLAALVLRLGLFDWVITHAA